MTDDDVLKLGCEVAGLEVSQDSKDGGEPLWVIDYPWCLGTSHPALPAYVASLLVEMVRNPEDDEAGIEQVTAFMDAMDTDPSSRWQAWTDDMQRIRAALVALGHEEAGKVE